MSAGVPITMTTTPQGAPAPSRPANPATPDASLPWIRFPPFPAPPPGKSITPFAKFKSTGIRVNPAVVEGEQEFDGLGILTVRLAVRHDLTEAERRKRKKGAKAAAVAGQPRLPPWFEEWEIAETLRRTTTPINPSHSRVDRLHQASQDFKSGRPWPGVGSGVPQLWDAFRLYVGIISSINPTLSRKRMQTMQTAAAAAEEEDESDDDDDGVRETPITVVNDEAIAQNPPRAQPVFRGTDDDDDEARQLRRENFREAKEQRMDAFFNDTEKNIKIFFSSYFRDKGLIWSEGRARDGPTLVRYFLNFLLRNRVLPEPENEKSLRKALLVIALASTELPATFVIGKALPDAFSTGCEQLFGDMTEGLLTQGGFSDAFKTVPEECEPDAKRRKVDEPEAQPADVKMESEEDRVLKDALAAAAGGADIEIVTVDTAQEDNADGLDPEAAENPWGEPSATAGPWGDPWGEPDATPWLLEPQPNPIMRFLGPTVFPFTHTTGIVERSTRRIVAVTPPGTEKAGKKKKGRPAAALVEDELSARMALMVLAPWPSSSDNPRADVSHPLVLPDSRGAVAAEFGGQAAEGDGAQAHNPLADDIAVLLDPAVADKMVVGMGLCATWTQLARQVPGDPPAPAAGARKAKGGPGEAGAPTKFWYMESLVSTLPSFHTELDA